MAVGLSLNEGWALPPSRASQHVTGDQVDRICVIAVDDDLVESVCAGAVGCRVGNRGDVINGRVLHIQIVLAHEHCRQLPNRGQIERLMECADVRRPVAEEADCHLIGAAHLGRPGRPVGNAQMRADDGVRTHHVALRQCQVHRAPLATEDPGFAPQQLGHHGCHRRPFGQRVRMAPVRREHIVVRLHSGTKTGGDSFHPQGKMARSFDQVLHEQVVRTLLELPQLLLQSVHPLARFEIYRRRIDRRIGRRGEAGRPRRVVMVAILGWRINTHWRPSAPRKGTAL